MRRTILGALAVLGVGCAALPAFAQSEGDFVAAFAGDWQTLDPAFSDGGACRVSLGKQPKGQGYAISSANCGGTLNDLESWRILGGQLGLVDRTGEVVARLGGNQKRMSGDTVDKQPLIMERLAASESAGPSGGAQAAAAERKQGCVFYGYTAACAAGAELDPPKAAANGEAASAAVLVRLNARAEARPDADIVATIPAGTCVKVDQCTTASDGLWCRAKVSNYEGWIRQRAVRQGRWPVLTFAAGCGS